MAIPTILQPTKHWLFRAALLWLGGFAAAHAQIQLDGTLGRPAPALTGPNFEIRAEYGRHVGRNLFHSFQSFNLATGESAIFSGPANVRNVLARVTGGSASSIDGLIQSTISGANLYLMNPAGIVFGPNASLDVTGAFTATTADAIRLADGGRFPAHPAERPVLTSADPRAFGFLSPTPQDITVNDSKLTVPYSKLSLIAGAVVTTPATKLQAPYSTVQQIAIPSDNAPREFNAATDTIGQPPQIVPGSLILDGTVGPAQTLAGPIYEIDATLGRQAGANLFHSFSDFQLNAGEFANFTGPAAIQNILVRVTGTQPSLIGGGLLSPIAGANLFLMNPQGVTLSSGASLTLEGSFLATTADYLRFRDGTVFPATPAGGTPAFSAEPLTAIGFLAAEFAARGGNSPITVNDPAFDGISSAPDILLSPQRSFILAGGAVEVDHRTLMAPGGALALLALAGPGEVAINIDDPYAPLRTDHLAGHTTLTLRNSATLNVDGERAGRVTLRGSDILLDQGASVQAQSQIVDTDVAIDAKATSSILVNNSSSLTAQVFGPARGGDLWLEAPRVTLDNLSTARTDTYPGSTGNGGNLVVRGQNLTLSGASSIGASVGGEGRGGEIQLFASDTLALGTDGSGSDISAVSFGGPVGGIKVQARRLELGANARLATESESAVSGGAIAIQASLLRINGGHLSASSNGEGDGGSLTIAADRIELDAAGSVQFSGIQSATGNTTAASRGGAITLRRGPSGRGELRMANGAQISTSSISRGAAGDIVLDLDNIFLGPHATIASSVGPDAGNAGSVILQASDSVRLTGNSRISVTAENSRAGGITLTATRDLRLEQSQLSATSLLDGGSIELKAGHLILLEGSQISASAGFDGGNILLDPPLIVLRNSAVTANSSAANAGFITVIAGSFLRSGSKVEATTPNKTAFQGQIEVSAPDSDLSGELVPLNGVFLHADSRLLENCATVALGTGSSFITRGRGGLSLPP